MNICPLLGILNLILEINLTFGIYYELNENERFNVKVQVEWSNEVCTQKHFSHMCYYTNWSMCFEMSLSQSSIWKILLIGIHPHKHLQYLQKTALNSPGACARKNWLHSTRNVLKKSIFKDKNFVDNFSFPIILCRLKSWKNVKWLDWQLLNYNLPVFLTFFKWLTLRNW